LNPGSKEIITAYLEQSLNDAQPEQCFQFERNGYFIADCVDMKPGKPVFNRAVTLRDSWGKAAGV
jgi:glutaminyl-tRNA synthetase